MNEEHNGLLFIVDISGYSKFVSEIDNETGSMIIRELLGSVIAANVLSFNISEIEGDAVLFYRHGPAVPISAILKQFEGMLSAFRNKLKEYKAFLCEELSIKVIVHYGIIGGFTLGRYHKLFGQAVVEAHRLLKNGILAHTYALISREYQKAQNEQFSLSRDHAAEVCENYDIGPLCYTYITFPPPASMIPLAVPHSETILN